MEPSYPARKESFYTELKKIGSDAFLVTKPQNIRYLTGFTGDSSWLLITLRDQVLFTDGRYVDQANEECPGWRVIENKTGLADALKKYRDDKGLKTIAYDQKHMTVDGLRRLTLSLGAETSLQGESDPCYHLRKTKETWELDRIGKASLIAEEALRLLMPQIKPGISERDLALELEYRMGKLGSESPSFPSIIAAGPQSALPHAKPTGYRLKAGDFVTVDFGAVVDGYHSDMTRTFVLGKPDHLQANRYRLVLEAQERALDGIKPGVGTRSIDRLAREYLSEVGFGERFGHGLGHSLGLEIHEEPRFSPIAEDVFLEPGMVLTVEPGLYFPGWGGLRIEDTVGITFNSKKMLTGYPKTLEEMTILW